MKEPSITSYPVQTAFGRQAATTSHNSATRLCLSPSAASQAHAESAAPRERGSAAIPVNKCGRPSASQAPSLPRHRRARCLSSAGPQVQARHRVRHRTPQRHESVSTVEPGRSSCSLPRRRIVQSGDPDGSAKTDGTECRMPNSKIWICLSATAKHAERAASDVAGGPSGGATASPRTHELAIQPAIRRLTAGYIKSVDGSLRHPR